MGKSRHRKWFHLWSNTLTVALLCCSNMHYRIIRLILERSHNLCHISLPWWARNNPCTDSFAGVFSSSFSNLSAASFRQVTSYHLKALLLLAARPLEACGQNHQRQNGWNSSSSPTWLDQVDHGFAWFYCFTKGEGDVSKRLLGTVSSIVNQSFAFQILKMRMNVVQYKHICIPCEMGKGWRRS